MNREPVNRETVNREPVNRREWKGKPSLRMSPGVKGSRAHGITLYG